ncbi:MAG TPA: sigma-70 family RNA polymerase sigma factor [Gemmataceae bacterium]|jgi:RNA polymerase sigma-70 factor (ECF subfamily)|nr:sigma-70 family RNA polymerase sigma factor [Gemmataceae bacterium]
MDRTPASLLEQVRNPADGDAWRRFVQLYTPLLYHWARRIRLQDQDAADLVQDVFTVLVQKLPDFQYDRHKSFRAWLKTVLVNKWRDHERHRAALPIEEHAAPLPDRAEAEDGEAISETEYRQQLVARALQLMHAELPAATWQAFREYFIAGRPAQEVAGELGMTVNAVYIVKCRVLRRLRRELAGLMD